jgi:hypothetical protein
MFELGGCAPMLFVAGTKNKIYIHMPAGKDLMERVAHMTAAGIQLAKSREIGELEQVIYVCEGWASPPRKDFVMPSQDPNRMEVLVFSSLDPQANKQTAQVYCCVRDYKGAVVELKPSPMGDTEAESPLLPAFLTGFRLFKR